MASSASPSISSRPRVSPSTGTGAGSRPAPPPRVLRSHGGVGMALGMALVAALDEPPTLPTFPTIPPTPTPTIFQRPRSDSTVSSDTFDGIYALGDDDVGSVDVDVDDVDMDDLTADATGDHTLDAFGLGGRGASDLERLLLMGSSGSSGDEPTARDRMEEHDEVEMADVDDDDEAAAVMAHLAQLDAAQQRHQQQKTGRVDALLLPRHGQRVVVHGGSIGSVKELPPRGVDTKRRVHKRTFGERTGPFRFRFAATTTPTSPVKVTATVTKTTTKSTTTKSTTTTTKGRARATRTPTTTTVRRARSLFREAAEDLARRRDHEETNETKSATMDDHSMDVDDETASEADVAGRDMDMDVEIKTEPEITTTARTPVRSVAATTSDTFQTPLHRGNSTEASFLTPSVSASSSSCVPASISPAPTFDKVAVVHATDARGKVDKFEWTVRTPTTAASTHATTTTTLPPPYLRDATKRRVHSSTFGSFARSFSFPTSTP